MSPQTIGLTENQMLKDSRLPLIESESTYNYVDLVEAKRLECRSFQDKSFEIMVTKGGAIVELRYRLQFS